MKEWKERKPHMKDKASYYILPIITKTTILNVSVVSDWCDGLWGCLWLENVTLTWLSWLTLEVNTFTLCLCVSESLSVVLYASKEFLTALWVLDVFNTDVDTLLNVAWTDDLVDDDTDGAWSDVEDDTGATINLLERLRCEMESTHPW